MFGMVVMFQRKNSLSAAFHKGAVSGQLTLFILYINDVFMHIDNDVKMMMFADDCFLYKSNICYDRILECLQKGLDNYIC